MATLSIYQGDADIFTETVTGISSLTGYSAKMYIKTKAGANIDTFAGSINTLTITYTMVNADSIAYPIGVHKYETKIVDASDHVYTLNKGIFEVKAVLIKNPHTT
jgi:hypothetical protein